MIESNSMPNPAFATVLFVRDVMTRPASAAQPPLSVKAVSFTAPTRRPESRPAVSFRPIT